MNSSILAAIDSYSLWVVLNPLLMILMTLFSISMIILVLSQDGNTADLGAISGNTETFLGKNKVNTRESKAKRLTIYNGIVLLVISILFFVFWTLS